MLRPPTAVSPDRQASRAGALGPRPTAVAAVGHVVRTSTRWRQRASDRCGFRMGVQPIIEVHSDRRLLWILRRFGNASGAMRSTSERTAFAAGSRTSSWMSGTPRLLASSTADDFGHLDVDRGPMMCSASAHGEAAELVGLVEHDVPVPRHQAERRQQIELGAHRTQARHAHVGDEHGIGRRARARRACARPSPGRRVDDHVPERSLRAVR